MRHVAKARVQPEKSQGFCRAIQDGLSGRGSIAGDEDLRKKQPTLLAARAGGSDFSIWRVSDNCVVVAQ